MWVVAQGAFRGMDAEGERYHGRTGSVPLSHNPHTEVRDYYTHSRTAAKVVLLTSILTHRE